MTTLPHWDEDEAPMTVCVHDYVGDGIASSSLVAGVVNLINKRVGFSLYVMSEQPECDVDMTIGVPVDVIADVPEGAWVDPGGYAIIHYDRVDGTRCEVGTSNTGTTDLLFFTVEHELGHCLGLTHDDWTGSIMRRVQTHTPPKMFDPWFSDHDRAIIRETFYHG